MSSQNITESAQKQIDAVERNPNDWTGRKQVAHQLYEEGFYLEAANTIWNAPEMPSTDMDVAFAVKIISRARPNRSIRLVYEVLRRNAGKAEQNLALARAFNLIGLPMLASRFYGAAIAADTSQFDLGFEQQSLWLDDSGDLLKAWSSSSSDVKLPFSKPVEAFLGSAINFSDLADDGVREVSPITRPISNRAAKSSQLISPPVLAPLAEATATLQATANNSEVQAKAVQPPVAHLPPLKKPSEE